MMRIFLQLYINDETFHLLSSTFTPAFISKIVSGTVLEPIQKKELCSKHKGVINGKDYLKELRQAC